jgi:hypothetical protein
MTFLSIRYNHFLIRKSAFQSVCAGRSVAMAVVVALGMGIAPASARADFVQATFNNVSPGEVVTLSTGDTGWAGQYNFKNASGLITGNYSGFCIDIHEPIYDKQTVKWQVTALSAAPDAPYSSMGALRAKLIAELWSNDFSKVSHSNSNGAAFQIAIWEIINETTTDKNGHLILNVTTGTFWAQDSNSTTLKTANRWLSNLDLDGNGPQASGLIALTATGAQDYVVQIATPAPPGLVLGIIGAAGLCFSSGWRYRKLLSFRFAPSAR